LVQQLDARACDDFLASLTHRRFDKHELLAAEGGESTEVQIILRGAAMAWRRWHGLSAQVTGFLFAGDLLGAMAGSVQRTSARAIAPGTLAEITTRRLSDLAERHPSLRHALYRTVSSDFALVQDHLTILGAMSATERVAAALLQLDRRQRARGYGPDVPLWLPMRRTDLASYLGLELPTLSRTFSRLRAANLLVSRSTTEVLLRDRRALADLAGEAIEAVYPSG
jgi:CRP-like cAMP-binding protein